MKGRPNASPSTMHTRVYLKHQQYGQRRMNPLNHQFTDHTTILHRILVGICASRIHEVQVPKMERTVVLVYGRMIIGERALPVSEQVQH